MSTNSRNKWDIAGLVFGIVLIIISIMAAYNLYTGSTYLAAVGMMHLDCFLFEMGGLLCFIIGVLTTIHYGKQLSKKNEEK